MRKHALFAGLAGLGLLAAPPLAFAGGVLRTRSGDLAIQSQDLRVLVEESVATTEVEQVFRNGTGTPLEAVYDFPLPPRGTFTGLTIWVDGKEVQGEVVERKRAEDVYSDVTGVEVRAPEAKAVLPGATATRGDAAPRPPVIRRDPGLLETTSGREIRLRVAPVPARGTQRVRVRYVEPVSVEGGLGRYVFPLASAPALEGGPAATALAEKLSCRVLVRSTTPLARVTCPSHLSARVETLAPGEVFEMRLDGERVPLERDLEVAFQREPGTEPRVDVVASRQDVQSGGGKAGTALLALQTWLPDSRSAARVPHDVVFALDASGSMVGHREPSLRALEAGLAALSPDDRFDLVVFSLGARGCLGKLSPATDANREKALAFARSWAFERGTDPRAAFDAVASIVARSGPTRPLDLVLVTDAGLSDSAEVVRAVEARARAAKVRVFALELGPARAAQGPLERLARRTGGVALAALDRDVASGARGLAAAVATPCLRAPSLRLEGIALEGLIPGESPAVLRAGGQVELLGRYTCPGRGSAVLEGDLPDGRRVKWTLPVELPATGNAREVERLYAQARADEVLSALAARSLPDADRATLERELLRVSLEGQILTPATSLLTLESEAMFRDYGIDRVNRDRVEQDRAAEEERREDARRLVEERRAGTSSDAVAMAPGRPVWRTGGGAGEPLLLGLAVLAFAGSLVAPRRPS